MKKNLAFLFFMQLGIFVSSQSSFVFELIDYQNERIESSAYEIAQRLTDSKSIPGVRSSWVAKFKNLPQQEQLNITIKLPGVTEAVRLKSQTYFRQSAKLREIEQQYDNWSGEVISSTNRGTFMLRRGTEGIIGGQIFLGDKRYDLTPIGIEISLLRERDYSKVPIGTCGFGTTTAGKQLNLDLTNSVNSTSNYCTNTPTFCNIDFKIYLVATRELYDDLAVMYGGYTPLILFDLNQGPSNFAQALQNNTITGVNVQVQHDIVEPQDLVQDAPLDDPEKDLRKFVTYMKNNFPKSMYDVAIIETIKPYALNGGGIYGTAQATLPLTTPNLPYTSQGVNSNFEPFALVRHDAVNFPHYAFTHEVGHLLGARHDNDLQDFTFCSRGYQLNISDPGIDRTIMATLSDSDLATDPTTGRVLYFSNPNQSILLYSPSQQTYIGYPLGVSGFRDVKTMIHNYLCNTSSQSFRASSDTDISKFVQNYSISSQTIFPNPTAGIANILAGPDVKSIEIVNLNGNRLFQKTLKNDGRQLLEIDLSNFNAGIYFLIEHTNNGLKYSKIIKNNE